jgi:hypothetical protein
MKPLRLQRFCIALAAVILPCACTGPRDAALSPPRFQLSGAIIPAELVDPIKGVHAQQASADNAGLCCWISTLALFHVEKREDARVLTLSFYVPDVAVFQKRPQDVNVSLPGFHRTRRFSGLLPGFHTLSMALPRALQNVRGAVLVQVTSTVQFAQGRQLYAGVLTSAYFE